MSLFDPQPNFIEHDTFLFAVLGLSSVDEKWQGLLQSNEIDVAGIFSNSEMGIVNLGNIDEDVVFALLGIFSLSASVREIVQEWAQGGHSTIASSISGFSGFEKIDDLLR